MYGFNAINGLGSIQVDENYRNMHLTHKLTYTGTSSSSYQVVDITGSNFVMFYRTSTGLSQQYERALMYVRSTTSARLTLYASTGQWVTAYVFGHTNAIPGGGNYGLRVFDGSGNVTYSSEYLPLKVGAIDKIPNLDPSAGYGGALGWPTHYYPSPGAGRTWAANLFGRRVTSEMKSGKVASYDNWTDGILIGTDGAVQTYEYQPPLGGNQRYDEGGLLVRVDVTGY